ncbi:MAG: (2Fe-2S)-binding protein [Proteobacteria bacterium]|nr:MAG: (2Fe-2S)-binding protein [Pseudomonadota bacterium]
MYVCICNSVTDKAIKTAVECGYDSYDRICQELDIASCCGRCEDHAREVISEELIDKQGVQVYQIPPSVAL